MRESDTIAAAAEWEAARADMARALEAAKHADFADAVDTEIERMAKAQAKHILNLDREEAYRILVDYLRDDRVIREDATMAVRERIRDAQQADAMSAAEDKLHG